MFREWLSMQVDAYESLVVVVVEVEVHPGICLGNVN